MSNSDYNKIISTINSVTQDYTYTPDPNNLICIDTSNNRIGINTIEPSCSLHISGGDIIVNNIYANTICGSVIKINANANASSDIITIDISNSTGVNIKTGDTCGNAVTINGVRVATTQHITNAIPNGVIVAYYSSTNNYSSTNIPNGWALCDGGGTPARPNIPYLNLLYPYIMKINTDFSYNTIPTLPSAPVFSIRQISTNSVKITWTEPINIGNSVITGYKIYSNNVLQSTQLSGSREYTVPSLTTGTTYNFTLTALNSVGESKSMPKQTIQIT
uniref:Fibronectin type-III domain-containing protein n=1 Tax=viral metagenome TaxID=1070528 RepID=A0A6C0DWU8_9ZZZZ